MESRGSAAAGGGGARGQPPPAHAHRVSGGEASVVRQQPRRRHLGVVWLIWNSVAPPAEEQREVSGLPVGPPALGLGRVLGQEAGLPPSTLASPPPTEGPIRPNLPAPEGKEEAGPWLSPHGGTRPLPHCRGCIGVGTSAPVFGCPKALHTRTLTVPLGGGARQCTGHLPPAQVKLSARRTK